MAKSHSYVLSSMFFGGNKPKVHAITPQVRHDDNADLQQEAQKKAKFKSFAEFAGSVHNPGVQYTELAENGEPLITFTRYGVQEFANSKVEYLYDDKDDVMRREVVPQSGRAWWETRV